jgi:outer membrane protein assembly factor BamE (lipoprotein component of BamABCDE complex)
VTKTRLLLIVFLPLTAVAVSVGMLAMLPPGPGVTKANFDRIEKGMTRAQVEEIMGRPSMAEPITFSFNDTLITRTEWSGSNEDGDNVCVVIEFDDKDKVYTMVRDVIVPDPLSVRLRQFFSWLPF